MTLTQVSTGGIKDGQVQTADLADGQVTAGKLHADALDRTYTLGADGNNHYTFTGEGLTGAVNDPALYLTRGKTYRFVNGNSAGAHPFRIQTTVNGSAGTEYNTGVTNNGGAGGSTIIFEVPHDAPDVLYYQCTSHGSMGGIFYITGALADGGVTTAKLAADAVDGTKIANNAVDSEHIVSGAIDNIHLGVLTVGAANIQSDAIQTAKIADGQVTLAKLATDAAFDDNKIINDISALALKINGVQNASRYNTNSISVETFQDANGIASLTGMARDTLGGDFVASIIQSYGTDQFYETTDLDSSRIFGINHTSINKPGLIDGVTGSIGGGQSQAFYISNPSGYTQGLGYELGAASDFGVGFKFTGFQFYNFNTYSRFRFFKIQTADSGGSSGTFTSQFITASGSAQDNSNDIVEATNVANSFAGATLDTPYIVPTNTSAFRIVFHNIHNNSNTNAGLAEIKIKGQKLTTTTNNATGNFISNAVTASASTAKMGVVITYKDNTGTATLNTDLKVYLSADNGSNFTQVTLVAQPNFATGVKMAIANDVTVTAGTQLKYKVEVANQAVGSKVTQITGVSMQY